MNSFDVIVVGARCAGSPTAMLLADKGYRVLLLDRSRFPSDVLSAHYVHNSGVEMLKRWGMEQRIADSGCPRISRLSVDFDEACRSVIDYASGSISFNGHVVIPSPISPRGPAFAPRRRILDTILLEAAVAKGAHFREGFTVKDLLFDNGRVIGVLGGDSSGPSESFYARIVVGADGRYSTLSKILNPATYRETPPRSVAVHSYWSGLELDGMETYFREGMCVHVTPTNDGLACVGLSVAVRLCADDFMLHLAENFDLFMRELPPLQRRLAQAKREEPFVGTNHLPNYIRECHGPGWALVGDSAYNRDPIMGQGISTAFRQAHMLADSIDAALSERCSMEAALSDFEAARNRFAVPMFEAASHIAELKAPTEETISMMRMFDTKYESEQEQHATV